MPVPYEKRTKAELRALVATKTQENTARWNKKELIEYLRNGVKPRLQTTKYERGCPAESATLYPLGTLRKGNDRSLYVVVGINYRDGRPRSARWRKIGK